MKRARRNPFRFGAHWSLRNRLAALVGIMTMVSITLLSIVSALVIEPASERTHGKLLQGIAHQLTRETQNVFLERYQDITTMATLDPMRSHLREPGVLRSMVKRIKATHPVYAWIGVFDLGGKVIAATDPATEGKREANRPDFKFALTQPYVADVHDIPEQERDGLASRRILTIAAPIPGPNGRAAGVLSAHLTWDWVNELQHDISKRFNLEGLEILIVNSSAELLSMQPVLRGPLYRRVTDEEPIHRALADGEGYMITRSSTGNSYLAGFARMESPVALENIRWVVLARRNVVQALAIPRRNSEMIFVVGTIGAVLFALLTWLLMGRITQPLMSIAEAAVKAKKSGFQDASLPVYRRDDEIGVLSESLNELVRDLQLAKRVAEEASQSKTQFLANMSHEIRTPLGAVIGFADLLRTGTPTPANIREYLEVIDRNSNLLLRIIDDILDLTKVEAGKMTIEHLEFSPVALTAEVQQLMAVRAREKQLTFTAKALSDIPRRVIGDPVRVRQVLGNILGNALKFTQHGGIELCVKFDAGTLQFRVIDTGAGISPEQAQRLFQPFSQADSSTTRKYGGTGLGLVLTKRLCEAMGGSFWLEQSELGRGSVFVATIRVEVPAETEMLPMKDIHFGLSAAPAGPIEVGILQGLRVLVVEDAPDNQVLLKTMLVRAGAEVDIEPNGKRGVAAALAHPHDVVLMDIQMPEMDGHEATRTLRSRGYTGPIVALTAHAMQSERDRCLASGFTDYLSKPIERRRLMEMLGTYRPASP